MNETRRRATIGSLVSGDVVYVRAKVLQPAAGADSKQVAIEILCDPRIRRPQRAQLWEDDVVECVERTA